MADGQAPSAPAPASETPITLSGSETLTSFDDVSAIDPTTKAGKDSGDDKGAKKSPKTPAKTSGKAAESDDDENGSTKTDETLSQSDQKKIRKILAKMGDQTLELTPDAKIRHKVSGEEVDIPLDDLLSEYAGKTDWNRKYTDLDRTRKQVQSQQKTIERFTGTIKQFKDLSEKDPSNALEFLLDSYGHDGRSVLKGIHNKWAEQYQEMMELDEPERKAKELEQEAEYYKRKLETRQQQEQAQKKQSELITRINTVREQHGIDEEAFVQAYQSLANSNEYRQMVKDDPNFELTPEMVGNLYAINKFNSDVQQYLESIGHPASADLSSIQEKINFIQQRFPHLGYKELLAVVKKTYEGPTKKDNPLKEKIAPRKDKTPSPSSFEPVGFDDI